MKKIYIWNVHDLYQQKINKYILENKEFINQQYSFIQIPKDINLNNVFNFLIENNAFAILHRNEHGTLWCTREWIELTNKCIDAGIHVLSFDFGYFNHYKSFMVDYYHKNCLSNIYYAWNSISTEFNWNDMPNYIKSYRENIINKVNLYKLQQAPLGLDNIVVIWGQWTTDLIKYYFYSGEKPITMDNWILKLIDIIKSKGYTPVVKMSPVKSLKWYKEIQNLVPTFVGNKDQLNDLPNAIFEEDINYKLIAHAKYHIINCSSVSNELLITNSKVIAMGRSWFDNLNIFYEPKNWNEIMDYKEPARDNVNRWLNWWKLSQCNLEKLPNKIIQTIEQIRL